MLLILLFCWSADAFLVSRTTQSTNYSLSSFVQLNNVHNLDTNANYTTIQAGINDLATLDGHTIFVEQGTYYENVVVNKSLLLIGEDRDTTIINGNGTGAVIILTIQNVFLSNFTVMNAGFQAPVSGAILLNETTNCVIKNIETTNGDPSGIALISSSCNEISRSKSFHNTWGLLLVNSNDNVIIDNVISGNSMGIGLGGPKGSNNNLVADNLISDNANHGIDLFGFDNKIPSNQILNNNNRIILDMADGNTLFDNNVSNNRGAGVDLVRSSENNVIIENYLQFNYFGMYLQTGSGDNTFYHNNFINNTYAIQVFQSFLFNTWHNGHKGNYWSDYSGTDGNGDGIGDTPCVIDDYNQDDFPLMNPWTPTRHSTPFWIQWWFWLVVAIGIAALVGMHACDVANVNKRVKVD